MFHHALDFHHHRGLGQRRARTVLGVQHAQLLQTEELAHSAPGELAQQQKLHTGLGGGVVIALAGFLLQLIEQALDHRLVLVKVKAETPRQGNDVAASPQLGD